MTTITELRDQLATCKVCRAINMAADDMPDRIRAQDAEIETLQQDIGALRRALRSVVIVVVSTNPAWYQCKCCEGRWLDGAPEQHNGQCIAVLVSAKND